MPRSVPILLAVFFAVGAPEGAGADPSPAAELAEALDRLVEATLASEGVPAVGLADDAEFLRRVHLDLHGAVPPLAEVKRFLADDAPDKRARLVDALLADPRFGENLADLWQNSLISPLADDREKRAGRFRQWLAGRFNAARWDEIVRDLLTATGKMEENPAVTYLIEGRLPRSVPDLTDLSSRTFLGIRLNCAQCHDHPVVAWKQEEFWGMAAFFAQIQTPKRAKQVYEKGVVDDPTLSLASLGAAGAPDGFLQRPPTFLGGAAWSPGEPGISPRASLARWITAPENPYFARAAVNRTWWRLFGRGIVQPVDDMHEANPPSHPDLLDLLARRFVESGFDLKFLTRAILASRAYQRTSVPGESADRQAALFGRMTAKVLSAGQIYDSLERIAGPPSKVPGIDARQGARWEFTQFFGESGDPDPLAYRRGIPHLLRQMNSGQFGGIALDGLVDRLGAASGGAPETVAADLFLAILSRPPGEEERRRVRSHLDLAPSPADGLRELAWALLMTSEFTLNH